MKEKTENLQKELDNSLIDEYIQSHNFKDFQSLDLSITLKNILTEYSLMPSEIVKNSNLSKSYVYAILSGEKLPSRDKIIAISLSIHIDLEDCNLLLKSASYRALHPKSKRDSILIYSLNKNYSVANTNLELERLACKLLA